eukprot:TRINITY_DN2519_c0_g1_i3.p1 TRINITY_DN2519_c0_g1~~TRINITY_DN2519_c0_g1_i3.p1  ORF type:complete len:619 (-),score=73.65 TRINITY_DN2519_c0_g1_i3:130-1923(-)
MAIIPREGRSFTPEEKIERGALIAEGHLAKVYKGVCRGKVVAVKALNVDNVDARYIEAFKRDIEIMSRISHPNLCLYMGAAMVDGELLVVTELYSVSLDKLLFSVQHMSLPLRMRMALDVAMGINWLHCSVPKIVHSDLKASNILVGEKYKCVVSDFGQAEILRGMQNDLNSWGGTPLYMAPEKLQGSAFTEKIDVYSFSLVLWEMCTRQRAFENYWRKNSLPALICAVCERQERPPIGEDCPASLKTLIEKCWRPLPSKRPSFNSIVKKLRLIGLEVSITDTNARNFWKDEFGFQTRVEWKAFRKAFKPYINRPSLFWLKALIAEKDVSSSGSQKSFTGKPELYTTMETFGNIVSYFGPLNRDVSQAKPDKTLKTSKKSTNFLDKAIQACTSMHTFHTCTDTEHTDGALVSRRPRQQRSSKAAQNILRAAGRPASVLVDAASDTARWRSDVRRCCSVELSRSLQLARAWMLHVVTHDHGAWSRWTAAATGDTAPPAAQRTQWPTVWQDDVPDGDLLREEGEQGTAAAKSSAAVALRAAAQHLDHETAAARQHSRARLRHLHERCDTRAATGRGVGERRGGRRCTDDVPGTDAAARA